MARVEWLPTISHKLWIVRAYNPFLALLVGLLASFGIRFFIILFADQKQGTAAKIFRFVLGLLFLVSGWLYAIFIWGVVDWDRPARAIAAITAVLVVLSAAIGRRRGGEARPLRKSFVLGWAALFVCLVVVAGLTLMQAGYIACINDRQVLLVQVTGETRTATVAVLPTQMQQSLRNLCGPGHVPRPFTSHILVGAVALLQPQNEIQVLHHVIITLPNGAPALDTWVSGDKFEVDGTAVRFSRTVHSYDTPDLYGLDILCGAYSDPAQASAHLASRIPFPNAGSMFVHRWWSPVQNWLWRFAARHSSAGSWNEIEIAADESPYYPVVASDGKPVRQNFLLVIWPWAVSTSRGSSPLEHPFKPGQYPQNAK